MWKIDPACLENYEVEYPGLARRARHFENAILPTCEHCGSANTADVQVGIVRYTILLVSMTTKFHLIPNGPRPGRFYCNDCRQYFTPLIWDEPLATTRLN